MCAKEHGRIRRALACNDNGASAGIDRDPQATPCDIGSVAMQGPGSIAFSYVADGVLIITRVKRTRAGKSSTVVVVRSERRDRRPR